MILNNFASIGKGVLYRAVGLQKNYSEVFTKAYEVLDEDSTGCYSCNNYELKEMFKDYPNSNEFKTCSGICSQCPNKKYITNYETTKVYYNEVNRFGYSPYLKKLPLLLFMSYHFMGVDKAGIIKNVNIEELAELLNCNIRSISAANKKLVEYGYIAVSNGIIPNKYINILLPEYKKYFALAKEGGRGYYVCSKDVLSNLISMNDINSLRISIRQLIKDDDNSVKNEYNGKIIKSYKELRNTLPDYCKPNVIRKSLEHIKDVFNIHMETHNVIFEINPKYQSKKIKNEYRIENEKHIIQTLTEFNTAVTDSEQLENNYPDFVIAGDYQYSPIHLKENELNDLVSMSVQYSLPLVIDSLAHVYKYYILPDIKIRNFGGLIRSSIKKRLYNTEILNVAA